MWRGWLMVIGILGLVGAGLMFGPRWMARRAPGVAAARPRPAAPPPVTDEVPGWRKVHVYVALCDNTHQGIVPVPAGIGNGQDPQRNLYWGARYGVKTFFSRSQAWRLVARADHPKPHVLERLVFRHATAKVYLVADAYDGAAMGQTLCDMLTAASGAAPEAVTIEGKRFACAGGADLIAFIGHNGLMDAPIDLTLTANPGTPKPVVLLCCASKPYFAAPLRQAHAQPLLWTTNLMCPEAYTLEAVLAGWVAGDTPAQVHTRAARAYSQYQRCSVKAAGRLLVTGW